MITRAIKFLLSVIILLVGMWLLVTPIYDWLITTFNPTIQLQVVLGAIIVYIGVKVWRFHPW